MSILRQLRRTSQSRIDTNQRTPRDAGDMLCPLFRYAVDAKTGSRLDAHSPLDRMGDTFTLAVGLLYPQVDEGLGGISTGDDGRGFYHFWIGTGGGDYGFGKGDCEGAVGLAGIAPGDQVASPA